MRSNRTNGRRWFWVDLETPQGSVWTGLPRDRINTTPLECVFVISTIALMLLIVTAAILDPRASGHVATHAALKGSGRGRQRALAAIASRKRAMHGYLCLPMALATACDNALEAPPK
ncbi:MAG: hypothetical protein WBG92_22625 [Thiohalocapsa sp.]